MGYQLGIDLGTTYTAAAVCRSSGRGWVEPEVVSLGSRSATVASVLFLAPDGAVLVGDAAERRALTDPDRVVREFKRRIGDPTPIVVAGRNWAPEELSARLVRWVMDRVAEREGGPADRIAITHPASWGAHKRDLLGRELANQGLSASFLAEPQAAALHYASTERVPVGATIAVYDLGGGTFDAAVVRKGDAASAGSGPAGFGLLGRPAGLERLGGIDFDEVVFEHVRAGMPDAFDGLDDTDPAVLTAVARIRRDCTEAKEALSSDTEVSIPVLLPNARGSVRLHRSEFEQLIRPRIEETVEALRRAVSSAGLSPEQLSAVLLVGGSSRIPLVAQLVSEQLGRPVAVDADPKNAIAKGAALSIAPIPSMTWPGAAVPPVPGGGPGPGADRGQGTVPPGHLAGPPAPGRPAGWPAGAGAAAAVAGGAVAGGVAAGGAGAGGAGAGGAAALAGPPPPARPGRTGPGSTSPGLVGPGVPAPGPERPRNLAAGVPPPPRTPGPTHEPTNTLFTGGGQDRAWSPRPRDDDGRGQDPGWDDGWAQDDEPGWDERGSGRRSFGLYVGLAGLAAVALIVVVLLWWPTSSSGSGSGTGDTATTTEEAPSSAGSGADPGTADQVAPTSKPGAETTRPTRPGGNQSGQQSRTTEPSRSSSSEAPPPTEPPSSEPSSAVQPPAPPDGTTQGQGAPPPGGGGPPAPDGSAPQPADVELPVTVTPPSELPA